MWHTGLKLQSGYTGRTLQSCRATKTSMRTVHRAEGLPVQIKLKDKGLIL